ncbi:hypothetical protein ATDW_25760 [Asticcacaulis sp. DW145]|uniref:hypothetical protein n=1 Tax=Asticcacaulis sp. DW145 TaxID=3095608 RepID=UPI00308F219D|nr:hypothetical protein ATDW_25760 [Asticcacaulis sp. DW145]
MTLTDVNVTLLDWVAENWYARNTREVSLENQGLYAPRPTLQFPLVIGRNYEGDVTLSKILNHGTDLTIFEKLCVKRAFTFRRSTKRPDAILSTQQGMAILAEQALQAMASGQLQVFNYIFEQMTSLHSELLQFGESIDNVGKPTNYGLVHDDNQNGTVERAWNFSYRRLFEEAVNLIEREPHYFSKLSFVSTRVVPSLFALPSLTGATSTIDYQGYLWYRLNGWWERTAETQRLPHGANQPAILLEPLAGVHFKSLRDFIGGWEALLQYHIRPEIERRELWAEKVKLYPILAEQLSETALYVARAVVSGNRVAAEHWIDAMLRWCGNTLPMSVNQHLYDLNLSQKVVLGPQTITQSWAEVEAKLMSLSDFQKPNFTVTSLFANLVYNMWQDTCFVLSGFLVQWAGLGDAVGATLSLQAAKQLFDRRTVGGEGDDGPDEHFYSRQADFVASFLRRNSIREWALDRSVPGFWRLAEQFDQLTREPMLAGRVYTFAGRTVGATLASDLILGSLRMERQPLDFTSIFERLPQWLTDDSEALHLKDRLSAITADLDAIDVEGLLPVFNFLHQPVQPDAPANEITPEVPLELPRVAPAQAVFTDRLAAFRGLISSLETRIVAYRRERIGDAPISDRKLDDLARKVAGEVFDYDEDTFLGTLFGPVVYSTADLEEVRIQDWTNFPKGVITDPPLDQVAGSDGILVSWAAARVKARALGQLLEQKQAANLDEVRSVANGGELAEVILAAAENLRGRNLTPLILIGSGEVSGWVREWSNASYRPNSVLPAGIVVERPQHRSQNGNTYNLSSIPVFSTGSNLDGVWVLAREAFKRLKITRTSEADIPIKLIFTPDPDDPYHGTMQTRWRQGIDTDASPMVRIPNAVSEQDSGEVDI